MDKSSECDEIGEDRKVIFAATKLKWCATLRWTRMMAKLKDKFLPKDYQIVLHR